VHDVRVYDEVYVPDITYIKRSPAGGGGGWGGGQAGRKRVMATMGSCVIRNARNCDSRSHRFRSIGAKSRSPAATHGLDIRPDVASSMSRVLACDCSQKDGTKCEDSTDERRTERMPKA